MARLRHHGDAEVAPGLVDLAVNVRADTPPAWLRHRLADAMVGLAAYPDVRAATAAVATRHRRHLDEVLLTAGAAEAFVLLARALRPRRAVVVHPQFTEPEAALRAAGHEVERIVLGAADGFRLDPALVPDDADLVVVGNPTNPTSVLNPAGTLVGLARPGRLLVVDEAFADAVPGEPDSLAARTDLPGVVVVRSLTKTWGLAGLRVGYLLGPPPVVAALRRHQPLWAVSSPALAAVEACCAPDAVAEADVAAHTATRDRHHLLTLLSDVEGVRVVGRPRATFVLLRVAGGAVREGLRRRGFAVRRGDTFPGLSDEYIRVAVRGPEVSTAFVDALGDTLAELHGQVSAVDHLVGGQ